MIRSALVVLGLFAQAASGIAAPSARVASSATAVAPQGELIAKVYDLASLAPRMHIDAFVERVTPLLSEFEDATTELDGESAADAIASLVLRALEPEFNAPGRELRIQESSRLRVVAPAAVHAEVARVLTFLESSFRRAVDLRFDFVELPAGAPIRGGLVPLAEADRILASGAARSFSLHVPAGRVGVIDATQHRRFIGGYEVEVADSSAQHYPRMESLSSGVRCAVRAAAASGGVQLALFSSNVALGALRKSEFTTGALFASDKGSEKLVETVQLELPTLLGQCGGFNLFLPDGQALVLDTSLALQSGSSRASLVVRCSPAGAAPSFQLELPSGAHLEVLDASWCLPPRAELTGVECGFEFVGRSRSVEPWDDGPSIDVALEPPALTDVHERLAERVDELSTVGPWIVALRRKGETQPALDFASTALAPRWTPGAAQLSWTLRRVGANGATLAAGSVALSLGATSAWFVGAQSRVLAYSSVEVACDTATIGPRVGDALDGLVLWARPTRAADGGLNCDLAVSASILAGAMEELSVGAPLRSVIDRGVWDVLGAQEALYVPAGGAGRKFVFHGGGGLELELELR